MRQITVLYGFQLDTEIEGWKGKSSGILNHYSAGGFFIISLLGSHFVYGRLKIMQYKLARPSAR